MRWSWARRSGQRWLEERVGQGAFRSRVTDAYGRRCAVTGERTLPVLEATHIVPYTKQGPNRVDNGILLRSALHRLFDRGLATIEPDGLTFQVSKGTQHEYSIGLGYYEWGGKSLLVRPPRLHPRFYVRVLQVTPLYNLSNTKRSPGHRNLIRRQWGSNMLFERWIRQFAKEGIERIVTLRRMAMNGSEQNRRLLIRLDDLDARTLAVLAKQGPADVRLQVARHPNLDEPLARALLHQPQITDGAFKEVLGQRIAAWEAQATQAESASEREATTKHLSMEPAVPAPAVNAVRPAPPSMPEPTVRVDVVAIPDSAAPLAGPEPQAQLSSFGTDVPHLPLTDSFVDDLHVLDTAADVSKYPMVGAVASIQRAPVSPTSLDRSQLDLLDAISFAEDENESIGAADVPSAPDLDERVEAVLYEIFDQHVDGISPGPALDALRDKISAKRPGSLIRSLRNLIAEGADPEAIVLAYAARAYWQDSHVDNGKRYTYLDWRTAVCLMESFDGYPDLDEAIQILEKLDHRWRATGCAFSLSVFLKGSMDDLKTYRASGGTLPPDLFFT